MRSDCNSEHGFAECGDGVPPLLNRWLEEFIAELLAFPGRHDDQVDALTQGLAWGRNRRGEVSVSVVRGMI